MALALEHAGMSVQDMADVLETHRNTVGNYLNGRTRPRKAVIMAWAMRTGVPVDWLRGRDSNPQPSGNDPGGIILVFEDAA